MSTKSVNDLIDQGYLIKDADDKYSGEAWKLPDSLRTNFDNAFDNLRAGQSNCDDARIHKEKMVKIENDSRKNIEKTLTKLKQFIRAVADKETAQDMFHTLGVDEEYPNKMNDFVTLLMGTVVPHLNDWDSTPQEIEEDLKNAVKDGAKKFADSVHNAEESIAMSTTATQSRDDWREKYEDLLTQIRNWLYLKLPQGKYDSKLDEYGFEVWDKPPVHKLYPPGGLKYDVSEHKFSWKKVAAAEKYEVQISIEGDDHWKTIGETENTELEVQLPNKKLSARIHSINASPYEESAWSDVIEIDARVPAIPQNLRWSEADYHGDAFALIEWDVAARVKTYELEYNPIGRDGEIFHLGDKLFKYEDILGTPGTYEYRVRGVNAFGNGDWSEKITIVIE